MSIVPDCNLDALASCQAVRIALRTRTTHNVAIGRDEESPGSGGTQGRVPPPLGAQAGGNFGTWLDLPHREGVGSILEIKASPRISTVTQMLRYTSRSATT